MRNFVVYLLVLLACVQAMKCEVEVPEEEDLGRALVEQGRTFVHHAMKRMAIILPAIFFKMGIAFTLLVLVTIVAINNGFIGFMLLVVGLSTVLAKLQEAKHHPVIDHVPAAYPHYTHFIDRSDDSPSSYQSPYSEPIVYKQYS